MSDDELDECVRDIFASPKPSAARDRLRQAIDAAVRAERKACAEEADIKANQCVRDEWDKGANWCARRIAAAIRNRSNTP